VIPVVVLAAAIFGSLLSPPLLVLLTVAWLLGAHALLLVPVGVWLVGTGWLAINAGVRHARREQFLHALADAPADVLRQLQRLFGRRPPGLRLMR
jgi:hypothetical protein